MYYKASFFVRVASKPAKSNSPCPSSGVSICTSVLLKQVNLRSRIRRVPRARHHARHELCPHSSNMRKRAYKYFSMGTYKLQLYAYIEVKTLWPMCPSPSLLSLYRSIALSLSLSLTGKGLSVCVCVRERARAREREREGERERRREGERKRARRETEGGRERESERERVRRRSTWAGAL